MDKEKMIKYALIAVGVYLAYKWLASSGYLSSILGTSAGAATGTAPAVGAGATTQAGAGTATTQTQTGTGTSTTATGGTTGGATGSGAGSGTTVVPSDATLMQAALYKASAGLTGNYTMGGWAWNYYRGEAAKAAGTYVKEQHQPDLTQEEGSGLMTAAQYHALLASKSVDLSGLGWGGPGFSVRGVQ